MKQETTDRNPHNQNETSDVFESFLFKPAMEMFNIFKAHMESAPESYANLMNLGTQFWGKMMRTLAESAQRSAEGGTGEGVADSTGRSKELYDMWHAMYIETMGKLLKIPAIGPAREYTEKIQSLLESFIQYQAANAEFQRALYAPLMGALKQFEEYFRNADKEELEKKDFKQLQHEWIKTCEDYYLQTLGSPEFSKVLANSMNVFLDFLKKYRETMEEYLRFFPVATSSEMDEMYREIYELKKQVKTLKGQLGSLMGDSHRGTGVPLPHTRRKGAEKGEKV